MSLSRFSIDKINISCTDMERALFEIDQAINTNNWGYICVTNARTTYIANHNAEYCKIQNNSMLTIPDGTPLVWIAHLKGFKDVKRVSGPDLLYKLLDISDRNKYSHYFYGSTPHTVDSIKKKLKRDYPTVEVKGVISPPFQPIEKFNVDELADELNRLKPTFFWCGLGAPKQEYLIALLQPKVEATICIGIGLAFEYIAGSVKRPPKWMQNIGMEGVYNNIRNPSRAKRFMKPFFWIVTRLIESQLGFSRTSKENTRI